MRKYFPTDKFKWVHLNEFNCDTHTDETSKGCGYR